MHAGSPRLPWVELPSTVTAAVGTILGARVVDAVDVIGGFSPGTAAIVTTASGDRAFVKVADEGFNPEGAAMHRREAAFMAACPTVPAATLRGLHDADGWVVLVLDAVDGHLPALPWHPDELAATIDALGALRAHEAPATVPRFVDLHAALFDGWRSLASGQRDAARLDVWSRGNLGRLADLEERWTEGFDGDRMVHADVRADNVLITDTGAVIVDWAHACAGAPWVDLVLFVAAAELAGALPAAEMWAEHGPPVPADRLEVAVAAFVGYLTSRSLDPSPPGLPTLRQFQADQAVVALRWLRSLLS